MGVQHGKPEAIEIRAKARPAPPTPTREEKDNHEMAHAMFAADVPDATRMRFLVECTTDGCLNFAIDWDRFGSMGVAAVCMQEKVDHTLGALTDGAAQKAKDRVEAANEYREEHV